MSLPTRTTRPVSSRTSRATACASVSPTSTEPPGRLHSPLSGSWARLTRTTRSSATITAPTPTIGRSGYRRTSDAHHLHDDALFAAPVKFGVEDLLPWAQIERAVGNGQRYLMAHDGAFEMRVGVVFAGLMMTIVLARRRKFFQPLLKIVDQPVFPVVHVDAGSDVHRGHEHRAFLYAALLDDFG